MEHFFFSLKSDEQVTKNKFDYLLIHSLKEAKIYYTVGAYSVV